MQMLPSGEKEREKIAAQIFIFRWPSKQLLCMQESKTPSSTNSQDGFGIN
jgi:hypothetical protein